MKFIFYAVFFIFLSGCLRHHDKVPEGIMSQEELVSFLIDLQLTEAKISTLRLPDDTIRLFYDEVEQELFRKHGIHDSIFVKSISYYVNDVKGIEEIYSAVVDSLSLRERLQNTN